VQATNENKTKVKRKNLKRNFIVKAWGIEVTKILFPI
jgi:hypothetical protein